MSDSPYTKTVSWTFKIGRYDAWMVTSYSETSIDFEETRKNGQEDTHMSGCAEKQADGSWRVPDHDRDHIGTYGDTGDVEAIERFFGEHGPPGT